MAELIAQQASVHSKLEAINSADQLNITRVMTPLQYTQAKHMCKSVMSTVCSLPVVP